MGKIKANVKVATKKKNPIDIEGGDPGILSPKKTKVSISKRKK